MKTKKLALCSILSALGAVLLFVGSLFETLDLTFACTASLIIVFAVIELKGAYPFLIYLVTGTVSFLILPAKFAAIVYLFFSGMYPILKSWLEIRIPHFALRILFKLLYFNTVFALIVAVARFLLLMQESIPVLAILFVLGNVTFLLFDYALTKLISLYMHRLRKRLRIEKFLK